MALIEKDQITDDQKRPFVAEDLEGVIDRAAGATNCGFIIHTKKTSVNTGTDHLRCASIPHVGMNTSRNH